VAHIDRHEVVAMTHAAAARSAASQPNPFLIHGMFNRNTGN
jgi:hypothetical protein